MSESFPFATPPNRYLGDPELWARSLRWSFKRRELTALSRRYATRRKGATLAVSGIMRIALALEHRDMPAWGIVLFSGVVSIAVGCLLYVSLPWVGLWVLGTLIAVELGVQGLSWLYFGLALRTFDQARGRS